MSDAIAGLLGGSLSPDEVELIQATGANTPDALYTTLIGHPIRARPVARHLSARRRQILALLKPHVSADVLAQIRQGPQAGGPWTGGASIAPQVQQPAPGLLVKGSTRFQAWSLTGSPAFDVSLHGQTNQVRLSKPVVSMSEINFTPAEAAAWVPDDQGDLPTCTAQASVSCIERMRALQPGGHLTDLSVRFLYVMMQCEPSDIPPPAPGFTRLCQARDALHDFGVCPEADWSDNGPFAGQPDQAAMQAAASNRCDSLYIVADSAKGRPDNLAQTIHEELRQGRPVAVSLPGYSAGGDPNKPTTWINPSTLLTGEVLGPVNGDKPVDASGHAVCLVGYQSGTVDMPGGYFVFRNSYGLRFARDYRMTQPTDPAPRVPGPGYGTIPAQFVQDCACEILSVRLPGA